VSASTERPGSPARDLATALIGAGFAPFFGTPCGVLAPLYANLEAEAGLVTVPREDNAVGLAAGAALAGARPAVLMQNSGFGQSVNALASLIIPYEIPVLFIVSLRGKDPDHTAENTPMGEATEPILSLLGVPVRRFEPTDRAAAQVAELAKLVDAGTSAALTIAPDAFGWAA
jgi:sulfopyruvate decarboxylase alpha subunit